MIYFLFCNDEKAGLRLITKISNQTESKGDYKILNLDENTYVEAIDKLKKFSDKDNIFVSINSNILLDFFKIIDYVGSDMCEVYIIKRDLKYILQFMDKFNIDTPKLLDIIDRNHNTELASYEYPDNVIDFNDMCNNGSFSINKNTISLSDEFNLTNNITQYEKNITVFDNFTDNDINLIKGLNFIPRDDGDEIITWYLNLFIAAVENTENYAIKDGDKELSLKEVLDMYKSNGELSDNEQDMLSKLEY